MTFVQWTNPLWAHHCGLDQGMTVVKRRPLRGTLSSVVVWIKAWKSTRVRGNYYILQNSWFGSIVAWIIVVWIKGWKSSRDDCFTEHYSRRDKSAKESKQNWDSVSVWGLRQVHEAAKQLFNPILIKWFLFNNPYVQSLLLAIGHLGNWALFS